MIAREAVHNAANHASPGMVRLKLGFREDDLAVVVADDGCGFEPDLVSSDGMHFGLVGMRERAAKLGGSLELSSVRSVGTEITVRIPRNTKVAPRPMNSFLQTEHKITIMIVDDHPLMRVGVAAIINARPDMEVIAQAGTAAEAVAQHRQHRPDITLMDLRLPDSSGVAAIRQIRMTHAGCAVRGPHNI